MNKLEALKLGRPRSYFVVPKIRPEEIRMLDLKKITAIPTSFKEFLELLNAEISPSNRKLSTLFTTEESHPIYRRFVNDPKTQPVTNSFIQYITNEVDFVHPAISSENTNPKEFYKGYFVNWDPIIRNLDIERDITDKIILRAFLDDDREMRSKQQLHIIKGNAGSGKSVLLKRVAWKAATDHNKLCLFYKPNTRILYDTIYETYRLCQERLYLFIDNTIQYSDYVNYILNKARKDDIPLTVIGCVRNNEYNIYKRDNTEDGNELEKHITEAYDLTYLNDKEIRELIATLSRHKSLGHLENKPYQQQIDAFAKQFGRELLVALYEATEDKSFAEIITDEYNGITTPEAQSLYLTVSILHRLGCKARAGFISRMHNINLSDFKERLFGPLEHIVFDGYNSFIGDFEYSTRHQQIAEMVFNNILKSEQDRFDEYLRIVSFLDVDYENDRSAFRAIINARKLKELFRNNSFKRDLYRAALSRTTNDAYLYQQMGLFELSIGNKEVAHRYLNEAKNVNKNDLTITHSLAEYELKLAEESDNYLEKESHLSKAIEICVKGLRKDQKNSSFYHTLIKISLIKLVGFIQTGDPVLIERQIKDTQKLLSESLQNCGQDQFLLDADSKFHKLINDSPTALLSLEKAFAVNKRSPYIALRLSRVYEYNNNLDKAIDVLSESLKIDAFNKEINHKLGLLFYKKEPSNLSNSLYHLKRGFTPGDSNHQFQYDYARVLFLNNQADTAKDIFDYLRDMPISLSHKRMPRDFHKINNALVLYTGSITRIALDFAIIKVDGSGSLIYSRIKRNNSFRLNDRVNFNLGFNYYGPLAINLSKINIV